MPTSLNPEDATVIEVGPGCFRRDLPTAVGVRAWFVDIDPGSTWPHDDQHDHYGEEVVVISGELIEGNERFGPGKHLLYGPNSSHRPRTETGVRLFGFNVAADEVVAEQRLIRDVSRH